jgi:hypothetical protein
MLIYKGSPYRGMGITRAREGKCQDGFPKIKISMHEQVYYDEC